MRVLSPRCSRADVGAIEHKMTKHKTLESDRLMLKTEQCERVQLQEVMPEAFADNTFMTRCLCADAGGICAAGRPAPAAAVAAWGWEVLSPLNGGWGGVEERRRGSSPQRPPSQPPSLPPSLRWETKGLFSLRSTVT